MSAAVVQRLDLDVERSEVPVAVLEFDAGVGKLDVAVVVRELVLDGPRPHLVLGHVEGPRLSTLIRRYGLAAEQLLPLGMHVASALHYLAREDHAKEVKLFGLGPRFLARYRAIFEKIYGPDRALTIRLVRIAFPGTGILVLSAWCLGE